MSIMLIFLKKWVNIKIALFDVDDLKLGYFFSPVIGTLYSGINVPPGITVAPPLQNFHIMILILFYINLGIAVIFKFFLPSKFFKN